MAQKHPDFARICDVDLCSSEGPRKARYLVLLDSRDAKTASPAE